MRADERGVVVCEDGSGRLRGSAGQSPLPLQRPRETHSQAPVKRLAELLLQQVHLDHADATHPRIPAVRAEGIAQRLAPDAHGRDEEAVDGQGGDGKRRKASTDCVRRAKGQRSFSGGSRNEGGN